MKHIYKHLLVFIISAGIIFLSAVLQAIYFNKGLELIGSDFRFATGFTDIAFFIKTALLYFILFYWLRAYNWFKDLSEPGEACIGSGVSGSVGCDPTPTYHHQHNQIYLLTHVIGLEGVDWKSKKLANQELYKLLEQEFIQSSAVDGRSIEPEPKVDTLTENQT